ncbi:hypothetical protein AGDE_12553 [Angomonas deanei]|uniref:Uncharacterized protein n=1 Tax=Angomonas deanei TaxID=59799 RepID=A0A7G2CET9_9TRYP|nr:hypothetical protein AGDE_12553 [Angomonas deanei]CAD2217203.1 hypothetical protein, conserved [Angomonas deanei]|eukprot:EPY24042.1 hypothetical protein AGDE_12553 [Angomonas deanei]
MDEEPGRTRQASGLTFDDSGFADSDASFTARRRKKSSVAHESDHDACPYISIRRSAKCLHLIKSLRKTSPFSFPNILASFSVKNDFMFYPPYPTYFFSKLENGELGIGNRERYSLVKDTGNPKYTDSYVVPQLRVGAVHGLPTSQDQVGGAASFEIVFIPWNFELQCYRVKGDEVVMEQKFSFRSKLFAFSFGCSMPCSIIRPKHRMSSHIAIFFHCNGEDIGKSSSMRLLSLANALHMTVFAPEYPGYGLFEGSPSETSAKAAAEHFIQYLFAVNPTLTPSRIVLMGHSIGTGFAMHIADYINTIFNKIQDKFCRGCVCPLAYLSDLKAQKKKSFFHPAHKYHCTGEERCGREPFAESDDDSHAVEKGGRIRCAHNTLAGIILLSPFASIHCVEYKNTLRKYNLHPSSLEMRMWNSPNNIVFPAPGSWADDCSTFDKSLEGDLPHLIPDPPLLFRMSRYLSFNRLPTLEVAAELQEKQEYFNYTPLLLVHGTADTLVPAYNSVAIATKLRQCSNGQSARVFLSLLKDNTHNNLECLSQCRRFLQIRNTGTASEAPERIHEGLVQRRERVRQRFGGPLRPAGVQHGRNNGGQPEFHHPHDPREHR